MVHNSHKSPASIVFRRLYLISILLIVSQTLAQPDTRDYVIAGSGLTIASTVELYVKDILTPENPKFSEPNTLDTWARKKIHWSQAKQDIAADISDWLVYGTLLSGITWAPLLSEDYSTAMIININVITANSLITNISKIMIARERPYKYYGTRESRGKRDNTSFFSGHSSVAFSTAVTNAMMWSEVYPDREAIIWSGALGVAGAAAYLRMAADMHYLTDVITGAVVGGTVGWVITSSQFKYFLGRDIETPFFFTFHIPLG